MGDKNDIVCGFKSLNTVSIWVWIGSIIVIQTSKMAMQLGKNSYRHLGDCQAVNFDDCPQGEDEYLRRHVWRWEILHLKQMMFRVQSVIKTCNLSDLCLVVIHWLIWFHWWVLQESKNWMVFLAIDRGSSEHFFWVAVSHSWTTDVGWSPINGHATGTGNNGGTDSIYKAYFLGLCKGISPQNMAWKMVLTYLHFRILEFRLTRGCHCWSFQRWHRCHRWTPPFPAAWTAALGSVH